MFLFFFSVVNDTGMASPEFDLNSFDYQANYDLNNFI